MARAYSLEQQTVYQNASSNNEKLRKMIFRTYKLQKAQLPQRDRATCYVSKIVLCFTSYGSYKDFKRQVTFKVIQEHWQWCHSIGHIRFPISLPLQLYLYLAPFLRYCHLFPKCKESRDSEHIPFGSNMSRMYSYSSVSISTRNLKCLASPITKIWLGQN